MKPAHQPCRGTGAASRNNSCRGSRIAASLRHLRSAGAVEASARHGLSGSAEGKKQGERTEHKDEEPSLPFTLGGEQGLSQAEQLGRRYLRAELNAATIALGSSAAATACALNSSDHRQRSPTGALSKRSTTASTIASFSAVVHRRRRSGPLRTSIVGLLPVIGTTLLPTLIQEGDRLRFFRGLVQRSQETHLWPRSLPNLM